MSLNDVVIAGQNWSNSAQVLKEYYQAEIFFRLDNTLPSLPDGQVISSSDFQIQMQFVTIQGNNFAYILYNEGKCKAGKRDNWWCATNCCDGNGTWRADHKWHFPSKR